MLIEPAIAVKDWISYSTASSSSGAATAVSGLSSFFSSSGNLTVIYFGTYGATGVFLANSVIAEISLVPVTPNDSEIRIAYE